MQEINITNKPSAGNGYFVEELTWGAFTSYASLKTLAGVTQGTLINSTDGWLRFIIDGLELIVAKKNTLIDVTWDHLNIVGCVSGSKTVTVQGKQYKVRLLKGSNTDPHPNKNGDYLPETRNSEWDRLFYPIIRDDTYIPTPPRNPKALYTKLDLDMVTHTSICQERHAGNLQQWRVVRAGTNVNAVGWQQNDFTRSWRPCLELIV